MMKTKQGPDFFKLGIRALALFQLFLAYLLLIGAGFGFEALDFSMKAVGGLMLAFLTYLLWIGSGAADPRFRIRVALGCLLVGLLPLLLNLSELLVGHWGAKEWVFLAYFLTGTGAVLELYWKLKNEY
ncbi:hypothetical protein [Algoriphagus sp. A40]|uniref:hypothetical protein n=1 Tax=Algoriphagus sp. A40 TaxID=1945863 RepID=UPI0009845BC1|nr:hypothetical protein [Algoriphagus sp. A40]OOG77159.1 hypothetical protein B0E43_06060 [Algoriphagus sp. A40]